MNKFAYWLGYQIEQFAFHFKRGGVDFHAGMIREKHLAEVYALVRSDPEQNYIPAIKLHRHHFGSCLKDAKDVVDGIRAQVGFKRATF